MDIPDVPLAFFGWLRKQGIPIRCDWDEDGSLAGLKIGNRRKRLPNAAYDVLFDRYEDFIAVIAEFKVPCVANVPDCVFLKRRRDGIKGVWFDAQGNRQARIWRLAKKRRR